MRFIGCDPGLVTGLCSFTVLEDDTVSCVEHYQLDHIGTGSYFEGCRALWKSEGNGDFTNTVVVCESFIITAATGKKTQSPYSLETIGAVKYFVETSGLKLNMVAPSAHKSLVTDDLLKRVGLYFPGSGHATDAARVAIYWALTQHKLLMWALKGDDD